MGAFELPTALPARIDPFSFSNEALSARIDKALDGIAADSKAARLEFKVRRVNGEYEGRAVAVARLGYGWSAIAEFAIDTHADMSVEAGIQWEGK